MSLAALAWRPFPSVTLHARVAGVDRDALGTWRSLTSTLAVAATTEKVAPAALEHCTDDDYDGLVWQGAVPLVWSAPPEVTLTFPSALRVQSLGRGMTLVSAPADAGFALITARVGDEEATLPLFVEARALGRQGWRAMVDALGEASVEVAPEDDHGLVSLVSWREGAGLAGWRALVRVVTSERLSRAVEQIRKAPTTTLASRARTGRVDGATPLTPDAVMGLRARGGGESQLVQRLPTVVLDTPENRLARWMLDDLAARAEAFGGAPGVPASKLAEVRRGVAAHRAALASWGPFAGRRPPSPNLTLLGRPGYRELYLLWREAVHGGVELAPKVDREVNVFQSAATLYERWCELVVADLLGVRPAMMRALREGEAVPLGEGATLTIQRRFEGTETHSLAWRPDLAVSHTGRWFLLDAKFRGDGDATPLGDEVAKMHAYRDGIVGAVGALALYPGATTEGRWYGDQAVGEGVGLFPLRPGEDTSQVRSQRDALFSILKGFLGGSKPPGDGVWSRPCSVRRPLS